MVFFVFDLSLKTYGQDWKNYTKPEFSIQWEVDLLTFVEYVFKH